MRPPVEDNEGGGGGGSYVPPKPAPKEESALSKYGPAVLAVALVIALAFAVKSCG